ncbi:unnamed protein product [Ranitomeya imitator]|uniref:Exportin-T n=1 Tax=Ranitomeya imitator TaxID=111125 RepID=A0ABN9L7J7_9NEOB|nr:unnamed protein product [Ranitomeya imitator]
MGPCKTRTAHGRCPCAVQETALQYAELTGLQQQLIRETLIAWLQSQMLNAQPEKTFIRNKAAQVFALVFVTEFLTKWPKFFFDILSVVGLNPRGVDLYLRILMAIDAEVVDRDIIHTPERFCTSYRSKTRRYIFDLRVLLRFGPHNGGYSVLYPAWKTAAEPQRQNRRGSANIVMLLLNHPTFNKMGNPHNIAYLYGNLQFDLQEARRNTLLKDTMREQCIPNLVESWYQVLQTYQHTNSELTCQCLEVIGAYVSWIDLTLIANDRFINMLLGHMSVEVLREEACDCLYEIVNKGMDPIDKTKLVESLCQVLQSAGFFSINQEEDVDFLARFSKLVNGMGQSLIISWTKLVKSGDLKSAQDTLQSIESKVPLMLQLLIHEDDDISSNIIGFCYEYLHILKQLVLLSDQQKTNVETYYSVHVEWTLLPMDGTVHQSIAHAHGGMGGGARTIAAECRLIITADIWHYVSGAIRYRVLQAVMLAVMRKLTYDEEYNFENEGEDEAMFVEYRKQLKLLLDRLAQVSPELLLASVRRVFDATLQNWQSSSFMEVEVAIRLLYMLGEAIPASHGAHFCGDVAKASALQDMMRTLVTSGVSAYNHTSVTLEFFETVVRYEKFFTVEPIHVPNILMAFLDHRGLRHSSPKVRSRTAYLFSRFVKSLHNEYGPGSTPIGVKLHIQYCNERYHVTAQYRKKLLAPENQGHHARSSKHMNAFVEDILSRIQDLLQLSPPENGFQMLLSSDDQLFIYETAGVLIVNSDYPAERKSILMRNLLNPLMEKFKILLDKLVVEQDEERQTVLADCLNHAVGFASRTSKAFSNKQTVKQCGCSGVYLDCLQSFLPALSCPVQKEILRGGVRTFLHRMIICLEEEVLPFIPMASEHMLKDCEAKDLQEFIPLINQITAKFKAQVSPFLQQVFMPLLHAIFEVLVRPSEENDQSAALDKQMLRRSYFAFLQTVTGSGMNEVIANQGKTRSSAYFCANFVPHSMTNFRF